MSDFEWTFGTLNYIEVKRVSGISSVASFSYDEHLRIRLHYTTETFTEREWDCILACVKQAKAFLKKLKRL
ncbi:MAG: hypothetical protein IKQ22_00970 [Clostridia bacterium]|nr:hypothetical protein [Clostridia bacterium]